MSIQKPTWEEIEGEICPIYRGVNGPRFSGEVPAEDPTYDPDIFNDVQMQFFPPSSPEDKSLEGQQRSDRSIIGSVAARSEFYIPNKMREEREADRSGTYPGSSPVPTTRSNNPNGTNRRRKERRQSTKTHNFENAELRRNPWTN